MKDWFNNMPDIRSLSKRILSSKNGILGTIIASAAVLLAAAVLSAPKPDKKPVEETAYPVTTVTAEPTSLAPQLRLFGRIETPRQSALTAAVVAHVSKVSVLEGSRVAVGDLLVQLDPTDATLEVQRRDADLTEAQSNVASLKLKIKENKAILDREERLNKLMTAKVKRHEKLRKQQSISKETLNAVLREADQQAIALSRQQGLVDDANNQLIRARAQVSRTEAALMQAKTNLERTSIRAPFDGLVTAVRVSPGELVQHGSPIVDIYDTGSMEVRAQIPSGQLAAIKRSLHDGDALNATLDVDGMPVAARLVRLSGKVEQGSSSVDGLFAVDPNASVEIGKAVAVTLTLPSVHDAIAVPVQALYGHDRIYVVENERLKAVTVERLGERTDSESHLKVLVRANHLSDKAQIVTSQLSMAVTGLKVAPGKSRTEPGAGETPEVAATHTKAVATGS